MIEIRWVQGALSWVAKVLAGIRLTGMTFGVIVSQSLVRKPILLGPILRHQTISAGAILHKPTLPYSSLSYQTGPKPVQTALCAGASEIYLRFDLINDCCAQCLTALPVGCVMPAWAAPNGALDLADQCCGST